MVRQSKNVPQQRIDQILAGFNGACRPHEAVAVLRTRASFQAANGERVVLTESWLQHYVCGERHDRNFDSPKISNLKYLPEVVDIIRDKNVTPSHDWHGTSPEIPYPSGTQTIWSRKDATGKLMAYAYTDSGLLSGCHFPKKESPPR